MLSLVYGGCDYWDRTRPLMEGSVRPNGIDLNYIVVPLQDLFRRMVRHEEFDAAEMSLSTYMALVASGVRRFVGVSGRSLCRRRERALSLREHTGCWTPRHS